MILKVCGMKEEPNIRSVGELQPDMMGFIFYPKSKRYVSRPDPRALKDLKGIDKVGVFVNPVRREVTDLASRYELKYIQLHGDETPGFARELVEKGLNIIKVFRVLDELPLDDMRQYIPYVSYFLFDTRVEEFGGSGKKFDWSILKAYDLDVPFLLSGGIDLPDILEIKGMKSKNLAGIDVNSRFEIEPGLKDVEKLKKLMKIWK